MIQVVETAGRNEAAHHVVVVGTVGRPTIILRGQTTVCYRFNPGPDAKRMKSVRTVLRTISEF